MHRGSRARLQSSPESAVCTETRLKTPESEDCFLHVELGPSGGDRRAPFAQPLAWSLCLQLLAFEMHPVHASFSGDFVWTCLGAPLDGPCS